MTMNINRRKKPNDIDPAEFKKAVKIIKSDFTTKWLSDYNHSDHPLSKLFQCEDFFESDQLFQLGYCIRKIKSINRIWYDKVIEDIKTIPSKTRADVLEMLVASMFHHPPERTVELPNSLTNRGWDVKVKLSGGYDIYIQVKNNGETARFQGDERTQDIERIILENIQSNAFKIIIFKNDDRYPDDLSWYHLKENLPTIMHGGSEGNRIEIVGGWTIRISDLRGSLANIHSQKSSYELLLAMPLSEEEKNNLLGKITDACSVLGVRSENDDEKSIYIALVRVPVDLPFRLCSNLAHQYFEDSPTQRASGVLFYKCGLVTNTQMQEDYLGHAFHLVLRDNNMDLLNANVFNLFNGIDIGIGRGSLSVDGINEYDIYNHLDMGDREMRIENAHLYQLGQINYIMRNLGSYKINRHRGLKVHIYYMDSDRTEKEAPIKWTADDEPLLF